MRAFFVLLGLLAACSAPNSGTSAPLAPPQRAEDAAPREKAAERAASEDAAVALEETPDATTQVSAADPTLKKRAPKGVRVRTIRPLSAGGDSCLEMYSMCSGTPELCTSAPLHLDCGQESPLPGKREWLRCACP